MLRPSAASSAASSAFTGPHNQHHIQNHHTVDQPVLQATAPRPADPSPLPPPPFQRRHLTAMAKLTAEERELLLRGLDWVGFKRRKRKTKALVRRFKSMFGEGPVAINKLFNDCRQKQPSFKEKYAFMTLQWLKTYAFEVDLAGRYGCCEPTVETKTKEYTRLFQSFLKTKVRFSGFDRRIFQYSCDGQNYNTYEFRMSPSSKWYNHKSHSSGVKYLYACHLYESRLVYMEGPVPCGVNDISMYKGGFDGSVKDKGALYYKVKGEIAPISIGFCTIPSHITHSFVSRAAEDLTN